ncbi:EsaB/YukD family protein [Streptomyces sp. NPDC048282]|uniref:EsaB/YukD family protein n=1 Tax=Streptomyces sp. NPDC048282 TaxID=3365528 RepID=UPI0037126311
MDEHCRITVVGERRKVDLAVPAGAPIVSYADTLARLCDQRESDIMPAAWTLGAATGSAFAPEWSLAELGVTDGQVLYLRDATADELDDPVVHDVAERVADVSGGVLDRRWEARSRTYALTALALAWLVATLAVLAVRHRPGTGVLLDLALAAGLALPVLAWVATERTWPVPAALRMTMGLCAVPALALCAWSAALGQGTEGLGLTGIMTRTGLAVAALVMGALLGAFLAAVAAPAVTTSATLFTAVVAAVLGIGLAALRASGVQAASVVAVVAFAVLTVVPSAVSGTVAFTWRRVRMRVQEEPRDDEVADAVRAATVLLVTWSAALSVVLGGALVVMAASASPYADLAAGLLGFAVLLRAGSARLVAEVVPLLLAGTAGLFTLLVTGPERFGSASWAGPVCSALGAAVLLVYGFRRMMRRPDLPAMARPRWLTGFGSVLAGGSVALAVATFGAFGSIVGLGHHI